MIHVYLASQGKLDVGGDCVSAVILQSQVWFHILFRPNDSVENKWYIASTAQYSTY